jgi:SAM-dependent methyltransferase
MKLNTKNYYHNIGLSDLKPWATFESKIRRKYNELYNNFTDIVEQRSKGIKLNPYDIKNSDLDFSLAITSQYFGNYYKELFKWFENANISEPQTILDIGCDNGILTCYLAILFPNAKIVGVDKISNSIKLAKQLASKFNINNVNFIESDILNLNESKFDLIVSSLFFHEALNSDNINTVSFQEAVTLDPDNALSNYSVKHTPLLKTLTNLLNIDGILITIDRIQNTAQLAFWHTELQAADLRLHINKSFRIYATLIDPSNDPDIYPLSYLTKGAISKTTYTDSLLSSNIHLSDILNDKYTQDYAELLYKSLNVKKNIFTGKNTYQNGERLIQVSATETTILTYIITSIGYRELRFGKINELEQIVTSARNELLSHALPEILIDNIK